MSQPHGRSQAAPEARDVNRAARREHQPAPLQARQSLACGPSGRHACQHLTPTSARAATHVLADSAPLQVGPVQPRPPHGRVRDGRLGDDGVASMSATFVLVVHPSQSERQMEASRHERTLASLRQGNSKG